MPGNAISAFNRAKIIALHDEGFSNHQISLRFGIPRSSVIRIVHLFEETGSIARRRGTGRSRVTSVREDRYVANFVRRNRSVTVQGVQNHFQRTFHRVISRTTMRRRLTAANLRSRRPLRVPRLLHRHKVARLEWAREHRNWVLEQWRNVLFSDETRIGLVSDSRRQRVWREPGGAERLVFCRETLPYQGGTVMFWGGIMHNRRTPLIPIRQNITGDLYVENIIIPIVYPLRNEIGENFIFQDDNARPHRTRRVQVALDEGNIERMIWPANSPDMNPVEQMWDYVKRAILKRNNPPQTTRDLILAAQEEWNNITQETINNLINSMNRRVTALLHSRGGHTNY